jgi:chromate transporter
MIRGMKKVPRPVGLRHGEIARVFFLVGSQAFGGWSTTHVLLEKELVTKRKVLSEHNLQAATTYAQVLPGATQVAIVSNTGYQLAGLRGSITATLSYLAPAVCLILIFSAVYFRYLSSGISPYFMSSFSIALSGVIFANSIRIGKRHVKKQNSLWGIAALAFVGAYTLHIDAVLLLLGLGTTGLFYSFIKEKLTSAKK